MEYFGGDLYGKQSTEEIEDWLKAQPVYRDDPHQWSDGLKFSGHVYEDPVAWHTDFPSCVTKFDIPVFFLQGRHDYDTPHRFGGGPYYPQITAPAKDLIWFEHSAHFPFYEEPELFNQTLIGLK